MSFAACQLCGRAPAACKSHIIPKQFYRRIRGTEKHLYELEVDQVVKRRFTQSGIWEQGILCPKCDEKLGCFDEYGYKVLPERFEHESIIPFGPRDAIYPLGLIDLDKFRMFLAALLWRASKAKHGMFRFIKIGAYESRLKDILTGKDLSWLQRVDCVVVLLIPPKYDKMLLTPHNNKYDSVNVVHFYLYPWKLVIKLDNRPFGEGFKNLALRNEQPAAAIVMRGFSRGEIRMLADLQTKIKRHHSIGIV